MTEDDVPSVVGVLGVVIGGREMRVRGIARYGARIRNEGSAATHDSSSGRNRSFAKTATPNIPCHAGRGMNLESSTSRAGSTTSTLTRNWGS